MRTLGLTRTIIQKVPDVGAGHTIAMRLDLALKPQPQHDCTLVHHTCHIYIHTYIYMYAYSHTNVYLNTWVPCESACTEITGTHMNKHTHPIKSINQQCPPSAEWWTNQIPSDQNIICIYMHVSIYDQTESEQIMWDQTQSNHTHTHTHTHTHSAQNMHQCQI